MSSTHNSSQLAGAAAPAAPQAAQAAILFSHTPLRGPLPENSIGPEGVAHPALEAIKWALWPPSLAERCLVVPAGQGTQCTPPAAGCVVYWCQTDWRVRDNWALWSAMWLAHSQAAALVVLASVPVAQSASGPSAQPMPAHVASFCGGLGLAGIPAVPCWHVHGTVASDMAAWLHTLLPWAVLTDMPSSPGGCGVVMQLATQLPCPMVLLDNHGLNPQASTPACLKAVSLDGAGLMRPAHKAASAPAPSTTSAPRFMPSAPEVTGMLRQELLCMDLCRSLYFSDTTRASRPAEGCDSLQYMPLANAARASAEQQAQRLDHLLHILVEKGHSMEALLLGSAAEVRLPESSAAAEADCTAQMASVLHALQLAKEGEQRRGPGQLLGPVERQLGSAVRTYCSSGGSDSDAVPPLPESQWHQQSLSQELAGEGMVSILWASQQGVISPLHVMQQLLRVQATASSQRRPERAMDARRKLRRCLLYMAFVPLVTQRIAKSLMDAAWEQRGTAELTGVQQWFRWLDWLQQKPETDILNAPACMESLKGHISTLPPSSHPMAVCLAASTACLQLPAAARGSLQHLLAGCLNRVQAMQLHPITCESLVLCAWQAAAPSDSAVNRLGSAAGKAHPRLKVTKRSLRTEQVSTEAASLGLPDVAALVADHVYS